MKVIIKNKDYEKILEEAKLRKPDEACGLIAGQEKEENGELVRRIEKVYLLTNIDHSNEHFTIDPKEQLKSIKDMRENGLKALGNWHSHPESPSRQSEEDKRLSYDHNASYLIISLMDPEKPVLKSFHFDGTNSLEEELIIE